MVISGFWGFATVFIIAVVILATRFSIKYEKTYSDKDGNLIKTTSYGFGWGFNKANKD